MFFQNVFIISCIPTNNLGSSSSYWHIFGSNFEETWKTTLNIYLPGVHLYLKLDIILVKK